jgi:hypothetical protein
MSIWISISMWGSASAVPRDVHEHHVDASGSPAPLGPSSPACSQLLEAHVRLVERQNDQHLGHARQLAHGPLDLAHARGAAHALRTLAPASARRLASPRARTSPRSRRPG